jgi:hypothetical protein
VWIRSPQGAAREGDAQSSLKLWRMTPYLQGYLYHLLRCLTAVLNHAPLRRPLKVMTVGIP